MVWTLDFTLGMGQGTYDTIGYLKRVDLLGPDRDDVGRDRNTLVAAGYMDPKPTDSWVRYDLSHADAVRARWRALGFLTKGEARASWYPLQRGSDWSAQPGLRGHMGGDFGVATTGLLESQYPWDSIALGYHSARLTSWDFGGHIGVDAIVKVPITRMETAEYYVGGGPVGSVDLIASKGKVVTDWSVEEVANVEEVARYGGSLSMSGWGGRFYIGAQGKTALIEVGIQDSNLFGGSDYRPLFWGADTWYARAGVLRFLDKNTEDKKLERHNKRVQKDQFDDVELLD